MSKEKPEVGDVWADKYNYEIRVYIPDVYSDKWVKFIKSKRYAESECDMEYFLENYEYIGKAKGSIDDLFKVKSFDKKQYYKDMFGEE